jgi:hypothetical protein
MSVFTRSVRFKNPNSLELRSADRFLETLKFLYSPYLFNFSITNFGPEVSLLTPGEASGL